MRTGLFGVSAVLLTLALAATPACKGDEPSAGEGGKKEAPVADAGEAPTTAADPDTGPIADPNHGPDTGGEEIGVVEAIDPAVGTEGGAESEITGADTETGGEDLVTPLLELAANEDTAHADALQALKDALAAGGAKLDVAKVANARGEALLTDGESEEAEKLFIWASETHKKYAMPVYNLAKLFAYAGDLDIAKEHLAELAKRGNKKLMKKVGVEPAFAPLKDDPEVRKIYEQ